MLKPSVPMYTPGTVVLVAFLISPFLIYLDPILNPETPPIYPDVAVISPLTFNFLSSPHKIFPPPKLNFPVSRSMMLPSVLSNP